MNWRGRLARVGVTTPQRRDAALAVVLAVVLVAVSAAAMLATWARQPESASLSVVDAGAALLMMAAGVATIAARRRAPALALTTATGLVLACGPLGLVAVGPGIGVVVCAYTMAAVAPRRRSAIALTSAAILHAVGGVVLGALGSEVRGPTFWGVPGRDVAAMIVATAATFAIPAVVGLRVRRRRAVLADLTERAARLEAERVERDRAAAAAERGRIARELHDVAAHDLSAIVVQAGAADRLIDGDPGAAKDVLRSIRGQGRDTLAALRQLVGVMRDDDADGPAPQPSLARLDSLIDAARHTGMDIEVVTDGPVASLPTLVDLAAYRVVQEALTNARHHAAGAAVTVRVGCRPEHVRVVVHNGPAPAAVATSAAASSGRGLAGMRERVRQVDGSLSAGPTRDGGWEIAVRIPLPVGGDS